MSLLLVRNGATPTPKPVYGFRTVTPDVPVDDRGSVPLRGVVSLGLVVAFVVPPPATPAIQIAPPQIVEQTPLQGAHRTAPLVRPVVVGLQTSLIVEQVSLPGRVTTGFVVAATVTPAVMALRIVPASIVELPILSGQVTTAPYIVTIPVTPPPPDTGGGSLPNPYLQYRTRRNDDDEVALLYAALKG